MKTLLMNGKIYDGTGNEAFTGCILFEEDRILKVAERVDDSEADKLIDLTGMSVSSGFIDAHSHNDWFAIKKDPVPYFEPFTRQGITTFVTGNCGISASGFDADSRYVDKLGANLFGYKNTTGVYGTMSEYLDAVDGKCPGNIAALIGHCSARAGVCGMSPKKLTPEEEKKMLDVMEKALKQGACGISLGLMYEPGLFAGSEELKKIVDLCEKYDRPLTVHPRANSAVSMAYPQLFGRSHLLRAVDELVDITKGKKVKLQYSHAIFVGRKSLKDKDEFVQIIDNLRKEGIDACFDIYNEILGVTVITVILPTWYLAMPLSERKKPLTRLKLNLLCKISSKLLGFGFKDICIAYIADDAKEYEGKTVHEIAKNRHESDLAAYLYLCERSGYTGRVNMGPYSTQEIISEFEKHENCLYMTDAWVEEKGIQNPSIYDCYPKFIRDSLLGTGDTMPNTIRKMTGQTADRFALKDRGYIRAGAYADFTVFNESVIKSSTPDKTCSFGIEKVIINGKMVLEGKNLIKESYKEAGRAIRVGC